MFTNFSFFIKQRQAFIDKNLQSYTRTLGELEFSEEFKHQNPFLTLDEKSSNRRITLGVYDLSGRPIFQNEEAKRHFNNNVNLSAVGFQQDDEGTDQIRMYTEFFPDEGKKKGKIVKIGFRIPKSTMQLIDVHNKVRWYIFAIIAILTLVSLFLTKILLLPLNKISKYLSDLSLDVDQLQTIKIDHGPVMNFNSRFPDEFKDLVVNLNKFTDSLRTNFVLSKRSTLLLAHELKTPMTILRNTLEKMKESEDNTSNIGEAILEVERLDRIIAEFTDWTILNNNFSEQKNIHAIKLKKAMQEIIDRHNSHGNAIIATNLVDETTIFANPVHLDLLVNNLITNGLKYSDRKPLAIKLEKGFLQIEDQGPGIPKDVMNNLGKPFNILKLPNIPRGTGLGLAWVMTICKLYDWRITFDIHSSGTTISIDFNDSEKS